MTEKERREEAEQTGPVPGFARRKAAKALLDLIEECAADGTGNPSDRLRAVAEATVALRTLYGG